MAGSPEPLTSLSWVRQGDGCLRLTIDDELYSTEVIFRTCYLFTDRCYLFLSVDPHGAIVVDFRLKPASSEDADALIGDFGNELLNQRIRATLAEETGAIRELIVTQAFAEAEFGDGTENS
jgi:His-Xaa-Ser system protein HxsD